MSRSSSAETPPGAHQSRDSMFTFPESNRENSGAKPLDKAPLTNRREENSILEGGGLSSSKLAITQGKKNHNTMNNEAISQTINTSENPFLSTHSITPKPNTTRSRRPPPPTLDMDALKRSLQLEHTPSFPSSTSPLTLDPVTNKNSDLERDHPSYKGARGHLRQKSQAEELVADIDSYLVRQEKENDGAVPNDQADTDTPTTEAPIYSVSREHSLLYESPLREGLFNDDALFGRKSEEDRFSFTESPTSSNSKAMSHFLPDIDIRENHNIRINPFVDEHDVLEDIKNSPLNMIGSQDNDETVKANLALENLSSSDGDHIFAGPVRKEPKRVFRVVNEDHPTFYMNTETPDGSSLYIEEKNDGSERTHFSDIKSNTTMSTSDDIQSRSSHINSNMSTPSYNASIPEEKEVDIGHLLDTISTSSSYKEPHTRLLDTPTIISTPTIMSTSSTKSSKSGLSTHNKGSPKPERTARLVSSYVEELRLKYFRTSNFLEMPPNLPVSLKQKNNLVQPKNIKLRIRTNPKQIGIKHGRVKQKLLTLEGDTDDNNLLGLSLSKNTSIMDVDHTKEFHKLLNKEDVESSKSTGYDPDHYLNDIPGDDAYDSDDVMAPLREKRKLHETKNSHVMRSGSVVSYFTRANNKLNDDSILPSLPNDISLDDYIEPTASFTTPQRNSSVGSYQSDVLESSTSGLHVANPDQGSD
ncbi:hypothetical protein KAFR_0E02780 [Kazachstania africana CBS 2517]|uniref:Uncharacterized protein n=1 Tax=Kazachstania africana (strain ATCC 22294 / BCRC 22015 / CBS 2517 / CECT 1963 / NBRC 1671 / NRRL Y-8276) TaxID=1071382 RepID=H2AVN0_KAZAF|nr:hypothetical protein KAFR_0E02780 [Kazachstania africana CBS 2517]CCF58430.1 hypothetical protein KAFR_0E02780 [Kazachstania africana CBS 2517]